MGFCTCPFGPTHLSVSSFFLVVHIHSSYETVNFVLFEPSAAQDTNVQVDNRNGHVIGYYNENYGTKKTKSTRIKSLWDIAGEASGATRTEGRGPPNRDY